MYYFNACMKVGIVLLNDFNKEFLKHTFAECLLFYVDHKINL